MGPKAGVNALKRKISLSIRKQPMICWPGSGPVAVLTELSWLTGWAKSVKILLIMLQGTKWKCVFYSADGGKDEKSWVPLMTGVGFIGCLTP